MPESLVGHLKLRHLQLLSLLDEEGSITRAASALHLTQPAVSAMLRELESRFGMPLVQRSRLGVSLTPAARGALRRFRIALAEIEASREEAMLADRQARARIRVGALTVAMLELLPESIARFVGSPEPIQVEITEGTVDGLSGQLLRGELDLVVGRLGLGWARSPEAAQLGQARLFDEPRCIVGRATHPLTRRRAIDMATLGTQRWVLQPPPSSSRLAFDEMFLVRGLTPPVPTIESASVHSHLDLVARAGLLAVVPLALASRHRATRQLVRLSCETDLPPIALSVIWRRTSESDPLTMRLRDALLEVAQQGKR